MIDVVVSVHLLNAVLRIFEELMILVVLKSRKLVYVALSEKDETFCTKFSASEVPAQCSTQQIHLQALRNDQSKYSCRR